MMLAQWQRCSSSLQRELSEQQYNTWIRPLKVLEQGSTLILLAPNSFIRNWVEDKFLARIQEFTASDDAQEGPLKVLIDLAENEPSLAASPTQGLSVKKMIGFAEPDERLQAAPPVSVMGSNSPTALATINSELVMEQETSFRFGATSPHEIPKDVATDFQTTIKQKAGNITRSQSHTMGRGSALNENFIFDNFVEGKSNQLALAATRQVASNPADAYNPLFIYGGVGLGKTHLMHAVGNSLRAQNPNAKVVYLHSERFVADMVKALQLNAINDFKRYYRNLDVLLIDDIQFFANKDRSQEEFFHTFNSLIEGGQQMIFTCDRYPKEVDGLEERLKSRFGWGLTVSVEPPELETRAAILMKKAEQAGVALSTEAAFFIAERMRSNVRELEGALKRTIASAHFLGRPISVDLIKESLKDVLALQERLVTVDNIQKVVAEYFKIKLTELLSKKRTRSLARPRQVAMKLAKQLTNKSLPEIGEAFGGRDHTTVLHACRKIDELEASNTDIREDLKNLYRILST